MKTPTTTTLLDLIQIVGQCTTRDDEVVATVAYLVNSGKVRLCGNFAGARIDLSVPVPHILRASTFPTTTARAVAQ
jgi:hypothetical protein